MNEAYERSVLRLLTAIQNAVGAAGRHKGWEAGYLLIPKPGDLDPDNQEVAAEVCRTSGMTAERWDRLTLAERAPWVEEAAGVREAASSSSTPKGTSNRGKGINGKMLARISKDTASGTQECFGWTAARWGKELGCSAPSVVATAAWKKLKMFRLGEKASRVNDRGRNPRGKRRPR